MRQDHLIYPDVTILMDPWLQDAGTGFSAKALKEEMQGGKDTDLSAAF